MTISLAVIHASPAAIAPVREFFVAEAPEFQLTNLLDDGLLRMFAASDYLAAEHQLLALIALAVSTYKAEAVLNTCSGVPRDSMQRIREAAAIPVIKIDEPMAEAAKAAGRRIGILYTFAPTLKPTTALLQSPDHELFPQLVDSDIVQAAQDLAPGVDVIVLAQVSMAHHAEAIHKATGKPTLNSLAPVLAALRQTK